ncbi:MAG: hypothetical protein QOE90_891 [Thermoplasmata archaeon]|jgi:hypothetical protein|nr:hypothetical protein [Thermoplasmata archaeon]
MRPPLLTPVVLLLTCLAPAFVGAASAPNCDGLNPNYQPEQRVHVFATAGNFGFTADSKFSGSGTATAFDTSGCATGDGDNETGVGGAQLPEVGQGTACDAPNGHHSGGPGASVTVASNTLSLPLDYRAGTDGQEAGLGVATSACTGNGIVSDSFDTDPFDCGQGIVGHFDAIAPFSATIQPNVNPHAGGFPDPNPWALTYGDIPQGTYYGDPNGGLCQGADDGSAWAFLIFGPSLTGLGTDPVLLDLEGCPVLGDGSSVGGGLAGTGLLTGPLAGNGECGIQLGVGVPNGGLSTPLEGTIIDP